MADAKPFLRTSAMRYPHSTLTGKWINTRTNDCSYKHPVTYFPAENQHFREDFHEYCIRRHSADSEAASSFCQGTLQLVDRIKFCDDFEIKNTFLLSYVIVRIRAAFTVEFPNRILGSIFYWINQLDALLSRSFNHICEYVAIRILVIPTAHCTKCFVFLVCTFSLIFLTFVSFVKQRKKKIGFLCYKQVVTELL